MNAPQQRSTVVGVFEDRQHADKAVGELLDAGFRKDQIGMAMRHSEGVADDEVTDADTDTESGALIGTLTGLGLGTLAGLGVLAGIIPVIGPAIAAGTLGVVMSNAAAGAGIAGLVGALVGAGVPEHEANYYHDELDSGRTIVTVTADGKADEATALMRRHGAYDMTSRGSALTGVPGVRPCQRGRDDHGGGPSNRPRGGYHPGQGGAVTCREAAGGVGGPSPSARRSTPRPRRSMSRSNARRSSSSGPRCMAGPPHKTSATSARVRRSASPVREERVHLTKEAVVTEEVKVGKRVVHDTERVSGQVRKEEVKVDQVGDVDVKTGGTGNKPA